MLKHDTEQDMEHLKAIAEAAVDYVRLVQEPGDGPGHQSQRDQTAAFQRLADLVAEGQADDPDQS
jgi:hypothetical protein